MSELSRTGDDGRRFGDTSAFDVPATKTAPPPPPQPNTVASLATSPPASGRVIGRGVAHVRKAVRLAVFAGLLLATVYASLIILYRFINPPASALMLWQRVTGTSLSQEWMPLERISPHLVRAVIMSEDASFCRHRGVAWGELRDAIERSSDGIARGGSTISMQTAKNLYLWPSKSYVRKAMEIPLTFAMEAAWPKARMLEIYLNIVEWGPGVFGAEAAARYHFDKRASTLSEQEAALLAVSLPAPLVREPGRPSRLLTRMADTVRARMRAASSHTACVLPPRKS